MRANLLIFFNTLDRSLINQLFKTFLVYNDYINLCLTCHSINNSLKHKAYVKDDIVVGLVYSRIIANGVWQHTIFSDLFHKWYFDPATLRFDLKIHIFLNQQYLVLVVTLHGNKTEKNEDVYIFRDALTTYQANILTQEKFPLLLFMQDR